MSEEHALAALRSYLAAIPPGPIVDTSPVERLLATCWHGFQTDDESMEGQKLLGRMEGLTWTPPKLTFTIERHGGTGMGSIVVSAASGSCRHSARCICGCCTRCSGRCIC